MDIKQMIATVQVYIHILKGVEVNISINNQMDIIKLMQAHRVAQEWMSANKCVMKYYG